MHPSGASGDHLRPCLGPSSSSFEHQQEPRILKDGTAPESPKELRGTPGSSGDVRGTWIWSTSSSTHFT
eukprot:2476794-Alexandrium_andersonii.AAC.1